MFRIDPRKVAAVSVLAWLLSFSLTPRPQAAEPSAGIPGCDEFYDKWEVPGAPTGLLAMAGLGREVMAANDCIKKNNIPKACEHWSKLLKVAGKLGPPLSDSTDEIEALMTEHKCSAN